METLRPIVEKQLKRCNFAKTSHIVTKGQTYIIKKYKSLSFELGKCYLVKIPDIYINNPTSVLAINWNQGSYPKVAYLKVYVTKIFGIMIYVDTMGYDIKTKTDLREFMWSGWLNSKETSMLEEILM